MYGHRWVKRRKPEKLLAVISKQHHSAMTTSPDVKSYTINVRQVLLWLTKQTNNIIY